MKYYVLNHKNKMLYNEAKTYSKELDNIINVDANIIVIPSTCYLPLFNSDKYYLGMQDVCFSDQKTITGEITALQGKSLGVSYALIGHSERREYFKETEYDLIKKINVCINNNVSVIYCIGESLEEKKLSKTYSKLENQIAKVFNNIEFSNNIMIAYEPIWAIGSGEIPTNEDIFETTRFIKDLFKNYYDRDIKVLYGGSVNKDNVHMLNQIKNIDGFLIGGASLSLEQLKIIIEK